MNTGTQLMRNPGPSWGFAFLQNAERRLPRPLLRVATGIGAAAAVALMPAQRRNSRDYLRIALDRPPRLRDVWRHFESYAGFLFLKLRAARGVPQGGRLDGSHPGDFAALVGSGKPAFFGTFHFGRSDLLGFLLGQHFQRRVHMVRLKVGNAADTAQLGRLYGEWVSFIWLNNPEDLLLALKDAVASGGSLAMQCDRAEFTSKTEFFQFLGARRLFPFTIYHLAVLFDRPVLFCFGLPDVAADATLIQSSSAFIPDASASRKANLDRARLHFQGVLSHLERLVRLNPMLWFNFGPLNPAETAAPGS